MKTTLALAAALLAALPALAHDHGGGDAPVAPTAASYASKLTRDIKSLSAQEERGWLEGEGMGQGRAAELNGYAGPMQVLEMAQMLQLTPAQMTASRELMKQHKADVRKLGAELVDAERQLDLAFRERRADAAEVTRLTGIIGQLQGRIRASHLQTHLAQTALLTPDQMQRYSGMHAYAH